MPQNWKKKLNSVTLLTDSCFANTSETVHASHTITASIGLISNNNEDEYRQTISYVSDWCSENYLDLNVTKAKEMILDMRKQQNSKTTVTISNSSVAIVSYYK